MIARRATERDAVAIAAVHVASWEDNYRGILPDEVIDARTLERRIDQWRKALQDPSRVTYVSCADETAVVGFASALILVPPRDGFDSYLQAIYLLSSAKGTGVGKSLVRALAQDLVERGCTNMALRVLDKNPARGFYSHLGARLLTDGLSIDAGIFPNDVAYAIDDLSALL
jgi:GNAT superfamily N-acetyltransferase